MPKRKADKITPTYDLPAGIEAKKDNDVAKAIASHLRAHPHENTVQAIAEAVDAPIDQVIAVLNDYSPTMTSVKHSGEGKGGGWLPEEVAAQYREEG